MTFAELKQEVKDRLGLSSSESDTRVGLAINDVYRAVTSSIGTNSTRRGSDTQNTTAGNARVTFDLEKVSQIARTDPDKTLLTERPYNEVLEDVDRFGATGTPWSYAIEATGSKTVTVLLYPVPSGVVELKADGVKPFVPLSASSDVPTFPESFHDVLVHGVVRKERLRSEKLAYAKEAQLEYETRLSELRYFLAKSIHLKQTASVNGVHRRGEYWPAARWPKW